MPEGRDNPLTEMAERVNAMLNAEPEPASPQEPGQPAEAAPTAPAAPEPAAPSEVEIDGEKVTLDQIREWRSGTMMERDYRQKTATLAEEKRAFQAREDARDKQLQDVMNRYDTLLRSLAAPEGGDAPSATRPSPEMRQAVEELAGAIREIREERQAEREAEQQARVNEFIVTNAEQTIRSLMKEKGVPEDLFPFYRDAVAMRDPDAADPITGELTTDSVKNSIRREFLAVHGPLSNHFKNVAATTVNNLKKGPVPAKPAAPGAAKPAPAHAAASPAKPEPVRAGWDREEAIGELMERVTRAAGSGGYTPGG